MSPESQTEFNNIWLRREGASCLIASVRPPFHTAFWPDTQPLLSLLKDQGVSAESLTEKRGQLFFLQALSTRSGAEIFRHEKIDFSETSDQIARRGKFRTRNFSIVFTEPISEQLLTATMQRVAQRILPGSSVRFRISMGTAEGSHASATFWAECVSSMSQRYNWKSRVLASYSFQAISTGLYELVSRFPMVRLNWVATPFLAVTNFAQLSDVIENNLQIKYVAEFSNRGGWPHITIPVSSDNLSVIPRLVFALLDLTRGATIELIPVPFIRQYEEHPAPDPHEYASVLKLLFEDPTVPTTLVWPISWVIERVHADFTMVSSHFAAGSEIAVNANGAVFCGEKVAGIAEWYMGDVFSIEDLKWEQLDAIPEIFGVTSKPSACRSCEWRYRCGGLEPTVMAMEACQTRASNITATLFELYCIPRRELFGSAVWRSVESSATQEGPRESIRLEKDRLVFTTASERRLGGL